MHGALKRVFGGLAVAVMLQAGAAPALGNDARGPRMVVLKTNVTKANNRVFAAVNVVTANPLIPCAGWVHKGGNRRKLRRVFTSDTGGAQWSWAIPRSVSAGTWRVRVQCEGDDGTDQKATTFVADRGKGPGKRRLLFVPRSYDQGPVDVAADDDCCGSGSGPGEVYPLGQCTWWVARQRTDLPYFRGKSGDAKNWAKSAEKADFPVGPTPTVGAVAVFQPGVEKAGEYGHVALVKSIKGSTVKISEANAGKQPGSTRTIRWPQKGLRFIHKKPEPLAGGVGGLEVKPPILGEPNPGAPPGPEPGPDPGPDTPLGKLAVTHYQCTARSPYRAHTVDPGKYWGTYFTTRGTSITHGRLYVAAQDDKPDRTPHRATVGIFTDASLRTPLRTVTVTIPIGGTGISFNFPEPVEVRYEDQLFLAVTAIDRFTAYGLDESANNPTDPEGCFVGDLRGTSPPTFPQETLPGVEVPTFSQYTTASGPGPVIAAGAVVLVFCKVYAPTIPSALPGGYWYKVASAPWSGQRFAVANTFLNGDPPAGPYKFAYDAKVPDC